jgi:hypothetical protein
MMVWWAIGGDEAVAGGIRDVKGVWDEDLKMVDCR